jgi:argininosuccinate lyase
MEAYNESLSFDHVFFAQDVAGSIAFARANVTTGILTQHEFTTIEMGLQQVLEEWRTEKFVIKPGAERNPYCK